jgi:phosphoethanolamine N-methyltransferase
LALQVLRLLGSTEDKYVVELGAGIGRFTGELAGTARNVVALDFMQNLIDQNKKNNSHFGNVIFRCGDAMELSLPKGSVDVVFSNWLLMYLSDEEVTKLAASMLSWLSEDGILFFRESCFRQSGDKARKSNPTHYRNPREYFKIFDNTFETLEDGRVAHLELMLCKSVDTYVRVKQNQNQVRQKFVFVVLHVYTLDHWMLLYMLFDSADHRAVCWRSLMLYVFV